MSTFRSLLLASWFLTVTRTIGLGEHSKKESVLLLLGIGFFPYAKIPFLNLKYIRNLCCGSNLTFPCGLESPALLLFLRPVVLQCHHHLYSDSLLHIPLSSQRTWSTHCMPHQHPEKPLKSASGRHHSEPIDKIIYLFCMSFPHSIKLSTTSCVIKVFTVRLINQKTTILMYWLMLDIWSKYITILIIWFHSKHYVRQSFPSSTTGTGVLTGSCK